MKIVREGALPVGGDSGLLDVRDRALRGFGEPATRGEVGDEDIWPASSTRCSRSSTWRRSGRSAS